MRKETGRKVDEFYRQLKREIVMSQLVPGQQITELELAASLGCSQSTVREVLLRLQEDGLIVRQGYRGTSVAFISEIEAQIFLDLRNRLEVQAARLSLPRLTEEHLHALKVLIEQMEQAARDGDEYLLFEKDQEFHMYLFAQAQLPALTSMLSRYSIYSHRDKIAHAFDVRSLLEAAQRHWAILEALKSRDINRTEQVLQHHVRSLADSHCSTEPKHSLRMSSAMRKVFEQIQLECSAQPDVMTLPHAAAREQFEVAHQCWNSVDAKKIKVEFFSIPANPLSLQATHAIEAVRVSGLKRKVCTGVIFYIHGGGWVFGSNKTHLGAMARLAELTGCDVIGIDYALAPEAPFPEGLNDCTWAWRWLRAEQNKNREALPWYVAGDSSGANLALSMILDLRNVGELLPHAALLFYGAYGTNQNTESYKLCGRGDFGLSREKMAWYYQQYAGLNKDIKNPRIAPLLADLSNLPPLFIMAAQLDPLRDDSAQLVQQLALTNTSFKFKLYEGVIHGFMQMSSVLPEAMEAFKDAADFLKVRSSQR